MGGSEGESGTNVTERPYSPTSSSGATFAPPMPTFDVCRQPLFQHFSTNIPSPEPLWEMPSPASFLQRELILQLQLDTAV